MEELLNKLIEKGWEPRGHKLYGLQILTDDVVLYLPDRVSMYKKYRQLVSKESGLWQFVCENEMAECKYRDRRYYNEDTLLEKACFDDDYPYRLIESALCGEDKLEEFLLQNIKIDE